MADLHDPVVRDELKRRIGSLRPDSARHWGRMTVDQMLWHVNIPLAECAGEYKTQPKPVPVPRRLLLWFTLNMPWPRGARTRPDLVATERHDFETERQRCLELIDRISAGNIDGQWPPSAGFGDMSGREWGRLHAKHLDHHLRQFGV